MKEVAALGNSKQSDVPFSLAVLAAAGVALLFYWLKNPRATELLVARTGRFGEINSGPLTVLAAIAIGNVIWIGCVAGAKIRESRARAKMPLQPASEAKFSAIVPVIQGLVAGFFSGLFAGAIGWYSATHPLMLKWPELLPIVVTPSLWGWTFALNAGVTGLGVFVGARVVFRRVRRFIPISSRLPRVMAIQDAIVLGTINEEQEQTGHAARRLTAWMYQGLRGLTGNLFISGAIGSGKSQIVLQILRQILTNFSAIPALLAIDPKRTFVRELRKIIETKAMAARLLWVSLDGTVKFNPIWRDGMLRNSIFTSIANSLRLASINFLGSSPDNRFWEQSSFNLLKNALIYCAAKYDYFTFRELYRALVQARDDGLCADLIDCLNSRQWNTEEHANIEMAINYFKEEFSQMDQKIRTSILATATSFLNEFLEYRVSRILSPAKNEITLPSVGQAVQEGKFICLYIENDALARSIGTLFKLLYQEAVLERVNEAAAPTTRYAVLVMDEYQDVATSGGGAGLGDDRYLAKARESKAITIAATQSVSSLENAIRSEPATREILQNFRTRIFGNSTDPKTIRLFQEPHGQIDRERKSHSFSESAQNARPDLFGGYDSDRMNRSESVSTHYAQEYPITAREFSRLRPFEAFAQVFDGVETQFEKLFLKPYYLKNIRTPHAHVLKGLREAARVPQLKRSFFSALFGGAALLSGIAQADVLFPNVCSVVRSSEFSSCMNFNVGACMCGWPVPRPCAQIAYYVPQTFLEVWPNSTDTFFARHPAGAQLAFHTKWIPFGVEDDNGTFGFQARAISVPLASPVFSALPCQGARIEKPCFDLMSEDLGSHWSDGHADLLQPAFLAWSLSPKTCILKGAAQGAISGGSLDGSPGGSTPSLGGDIGGCSFPQILPKYPPSVREACNGWGEFFPRSGIYHGASRAGAALMIAARLKSISTEVAHTVPGDADEVWQMLYPQGSSCFKEGQNLGALETWKGVREEQRIFGKPNGYLFVVWKHVSCCRDIPEAPGAAIEIEALRAVCQTVPGGGT